MEKHFRNVDWLRVKRFALIQLVIIGAVAILVNAITKNLLGTDRFSPEKFIGRFFNTPYYQLKNVDGLGIIVHHPDYQEPLYDYWLCFDCDSRPELKDEQEYAKGGDQIELTNFFMKRFPDRALSLMHSSDIDCLRRVDSRCEARWLFHNRKTNTYFFRCQYVRNGGDM